MFNSYPEVDYENALPKRNAESSRFIRTVIQEADRAKEIDTIIRQRTAENSYNKALWSTQDISNELKEIRRQSFLQEMRRRQTRENSSELRKLEKDIQRSYVCKTLAQQVREREEKIREEKRHRQLEIERAVREMKHVKELVVAEENQERLKKARFREDLRNQISERQKTKMNEYQEYLEEKQKLDALNVKLAKEAEKAKQDKQEHKLKSMEDLKEFIRKKEEWCKAQQADTKDEEARIHEWCFKKEMDKIQSEELKKVKLTHRARIGERIGTKTLKIQNEKKKREELLIDLLVEEGKAKSEEAERKELERITRELDANRRAAIHYEEEIVPLKLQEQKELDRIFYEEELRVLAERDQLQKLSDEKLRHKLTEHRRSLLDILDDNNRRKAEEMKKIIIEHEKIVKDAEDKEKLVRDERISMLKKHAPFIKGYFPRGVLRDSDLEFIDLSTTKQS